MATNIAILISRPAHKVLSSCRQRRKTMHKQFSIAAAKNKLPSIIHDVEEGTAVELTRRGKPVAVVMSKQAYEQLTRKKEGFWNALANFRKDMLQEDAEIQDSDFNGLRESSGGREVDLS